MTENNILTEKTRKDRARYQVIIKALDALGDRVDPLSVNVGTLTDTVAESRDFVESSFDVQEGITALASLVDLRAKQDDLLKEIVRGNELFVSQQFRKGLFATLSDDHALAKLASQVDNEFPLHSYPKIAGLIEIDGKLALKSLASILPKIDWDVKPWQRPEKRKLVVPEGIKPKLLSALKEIWQSSEYDVRYPVLEFVIKDSFEDSIVHLEALSFFVSSKQAVLLNAEPSEIPRAGKYVLLFPSSENAEMGSSASVVFSLNKKEWKAYRDAFQSGDLASRPQSKTFD